MIDLSSHFARDDQRRHSEWLRQQKWFIKAKEERERDQRLEDKLDSDYDTIVSAFVAATEEAVRKFEAKLDKYDEATVKALMENQQQLDLVNEQMDELLKRAHVMHDGRRVFLTEDRTEAFDEFVNNVTSEELDFDDVSPVAPTWEQWSELNARRDDLTEERREILEFQDKVDKAREQVADGKISEKDLEDLDAELLDVVPESVSMHVPDLAGSKATPDLKAGFQPSAKAQLPQVRTPSFDQNIPG